MQKALMVFSSSPKLIIVKADEQFDDYVSNFTYTQKVQNKKKLCIYFKRKFLQWWTDHQKLKHSCNFDKKHRSKTNFLSVKLYICLTHARSQFVFDLCFLSKLQLLILFIIKLYVRNDIFKKFHFQNQGFQFSLLLKKRELDSSSFSVFATKLFHRNVQSWTKYLRQTLVFMSNSALREMFNCYFSGVSC